MKAEEKQTPDTDPVPEIFSIKEKVEAANYAIRIRGRDCEAGDEDVSDVVGEVYGG